MKKAIFAGVIALGMLGTGVAITTKPADAAVSYAKYTVSPKVRGNWKLKSVKHPNPEYTKMQEALDSLKTRIRARLDAGKGDIFGRADKWIDTVPTDEEVAALKLLMELSDAYTARAVENMNLMRRAIGLFDYQVPEVSDRRKAMTIVHALAEYEAGLIPKYQAYTHLGTVASKLIPTAIVQGTNENYYPSYNKYPNQS